jgi:hypothetical protein
MFPVAVLLAVFLGTALRRGRPGLTFLEFRRAGLPLGLFNCLVYWLFLG